MVKYVKMWVEWCHSCGHGFKVNAEVVQFTTKTGKVGFIGKLLKRKPKAVTENIKPEPSPCPVCGKVDNVTVIELQEDKIAVPDSRS